MPTVVWQKVKEPKHDKDVKARIYTFLNKLGEDSSLPGLHIEPIAGSVDSRVRTGRVSDFWRAILFELNPPDGEKTFVYAGTWRHDEGTARAQKLTLAINPVNGLPEFRETTSDLAPLTKTPEEPAAAAETPLLAAKQYLVSDLTEQFGFDEGLAARAFAAVDEDALLAIAAEANAWQADVLLEMATGTAIHEIKEKLDLDRPVPVDVGVHDDTRLVEALKHPAARMQFTFIEDDDELRRVIEDGDFGAWRVFLHPEQQRYVDAANSGSFRLTGGAGTGKTVVLLHRARRLHRANPAARIVLTTFTRALAENLRRDLERLDPGVAFADHLGAPGVHVRGVDQLAGEVRFRAGVDFASAAREAIGDTRDSNARFAQPDWDAAIRQTGDALPTSLRSAQFFSDEYAQIVLPHGITTAEGYFAVRRPGRGVALDRAKRAAVWKVIEQMRKDQRIANALDFGEIAAVSARWMNEADARFADHVLVDEGQDLEPSKWLLLRAIVGDGRDDLFIADDTHQRIYGHPTVLKRYGIYIRGRSRRLTLNYRTTLENLQYAMSILAGVEYTDSQGALVSTSGYRSSRSGPVPRVHATPDEPTMLDAIARDVEEWIAADVRPETIAILTATNGAAKKVHQGLARRRVASALVTSPVVGAGAPAVMTMHTAKGMEFSRVVLFDVSDGSFPSPFLMKDVLDEDRADRMKQARSLLYVAASRARDELVVTWKGAPSDLLVG